jgi:hypothetical protein
MIRPLWQLLLLTRNRQNPIRLTCEECFALLEFDAELLESGDAIENIRPTARHHLSLCRGCQAKFDRWMRNSPSWAEATRIADSHEK